MAQGVVKSYDPNTGNGIILLDTDKTEVFITAGSLKGSIFRTLRQGQRINFELETVEDIQVVKNVKIVLLLTCEKWIQRRSKLGQPRSHRIEKSRRRRC